MVVPQQRSAGAVRRPFRQGPSDHVCWGYSSDAERAQLVTSWLADGMRQRQRALYVAPAAPDELLAELAGLPGLASARTGGALAVVSSADLYDLSRPIDPADQLAVYSAAVDAAVRDGYLGLRVAADITPLVVDVDRRASHLHWEQVADRYIVEHPLAPLCLYDVRRVRGLDAITCGHPGQGPQPAPFCLYGVDATGAAVHGEIDACVADTFAEVLRALPDTDRRLDVSRVMFIDGRCAAMLSDEVARRRARGQRLVVTGASSLVRRIWGLCALDEELLEPA